MSLEITVSGLPHVTAMTVVVRSCLVWCNGTTTRIQEGNN